MVRDIELRVLAAKSGFGAHRPITRRERERLLASERYEKSLGSPHHASHYRRSLPDGSCLHLVVEDDHASLHCDRFDPHRDPVSLGWHLVTEARSEWMASVAFAYFVVKLLAR